MDEKRLTLILAAVEGSIDEVVTRRLIIESGGSVGTIYGGNGKRLLHQRIKAYDQSARRFPWIVIVDLDHDYDCPPSLQKVWLPNPAQWMCFRVAVREVEAWLLADREHLSRFLDVPLSKIPDNPEELDDPKRTMVELAQGSHRQDIRKDMVPRVGSGRHVGPAYASRLMEFASDQKLGWRPAIASHHSDSLDRSLRCLRRLVERFPRSIQ